MSGGWSNSGRRDRLPADWPRIRKRILKRDRRECQTLVDGEPCGMDANEVDHIRAGDDHHDANLEAICTYHHARKSSCEGNAARAVRRRQADSRFRRTEEHPGLI